MRRRILYATSILCALLAVGCRRKLGKVHFRLYAGNRRESSRGLPGTELELQCRGRGGIERHKLKCDKQGRVVGELLSGRYAVTCRHPQRVTETFAVRISGRRPQAVTLHLVRPGGGFYLRPRDAAGARLASGRCRIYDAERRKLVDRKFELAPSRDFFTISGLPRDAKHTAVVSAPGALPGDVPDVAALAPGRTRFHRARLIGQDYAAEETPGAKLELVGGVPVLHVHGDGREAGLAMGTLIGSRVRALLRYEADDLLPRRWLPRIDSISARDLQHVPADHREEMAGLAKGSRITAHELLRAHVMVELLQMACTAIAVRGERTTDGKLLFGRNVDFPVTPGTIKSSLLVVYHSKKRKSFVSVGWPGLTGVVTGMNQDGLCVGNLLVMGFSFPRKGTPYLFLIRRALEECSTVEEAAELFRKSRRTMPHNIFVADKKSAAVLECTPRGVLVRRMAKDGPLLCSNSFARKAQRHCRRYRTMALQSGRSGRLDVKGITAILDAVALRRINIQSMVFRPADMKLHLSVHQAPASAGKFVELDCRQLLGKR